MNFCMASKIKTYFQITWFNLSVFITVMNEFTYLTENLHLENRAINYLYIYMIKCSTSTKKSVMSNSKSVIYRDVHRSRQKLKCIFKTLQIIANEKVYFDKIYKRLSSLFSYLINDQTIMQCIFHT